MHKRIVIALCWFENHFRFGDSSMLLILRIVISWRWPAKWQQRQSRTNMQKHACELYSWEKV